MMLESVLDVTYQCLRRPYITAAYNAVAVPISSLVLCMSA